MGGDEGRGAGPGLEACAEDRPSIQVDWPKPAVVV